MITLATLKDATAQQVFDQVAKHMLTQNKQSRSLDDDTCEYRGPNNLKCAAGCLIGDAEYKPEMDMPTIIDGVQIGTDWLTLVKRGFVPEDFKFLIRDLQIIHDSNPEFSWGSALRDLADNYGLSPDILWTI